MATTNDPTMPEGPGATGLAGSQGAQVVAMFATLEQARAARDRLAQDGIPAADMDIVNGAMVRRSDPMVRYGEHGSF
jgi:hypothetical protein